MTRNLVFVIGVVFLFNSFVSAAGPLTGTYLEARTCQVYTGPCFANGEVGLMGKNAVLSWRINDGVQDGVDLKGLSVAVVLKASHTLGFKGLADAKKVQAIVFVDENANVSQQESLQEFVLAQTGLAAANIQHVSTAPIQMDFDEAKVTARLKVGKYVKLDTRKARPGDCICSNESAYYPPLVKLQGAAPGVTIEGDVKARKLGTSWSIPDSRTAYLGRFGSDENESKVAKR